MKNSIKQWLCGMGILLIAITSINAQVIIDNYTVDGFPVDSSLDTLDRWVTLSGLLGLHTREVTVRLSGESKSIRGIGFEANGEHTQGYRSFGNFRLSTNDNLVLEFDMVAIGNNAQALLGLGNVGGFDANAVPPLVGVFSRFGFVVRPGGQGEFISAVDSSGNAILAKRGHLYRVRSVWRLAGGGEASLEIKDLSAGETDFRQLYFDTEQTMAFANLGLDNAVISSAMVGFWEHLFFRTGGSESQAGLVNRISVVR
jgi:hypothetical protein